MTPQEFADAHLHPYMVKGDEIVPTLCPFCHGGQHHDKHTFALNVSNQTYNCKRGSCGVQGHFSQLCNAFGVGSRTGGHGKQYKKPEIKAKSINDQAAAYLQLRGIGDTTAAAYRVGVDDNGNLVFPFHDDTGKHVFNKFRYARKLKAGERKAWRENGTKPVLFGMHLCDPKQPLTICEGEFDAMACHESGIPNAVSVPSGAQDFEWLDTCWDFVEQFDGVFLFGDNDAPGREMIDKLCVKLSHKRIHVVEHECKDANELLFKQGKESVLEAWSQAKEIPAFGLLNLAEVTSLDIQNVDAAKSSIPQLDQMIGGFMMGDVSVWTGKRGDGKSTVLSMLMLDGIADDKRVCAYSGELRADRFQYWADLQAAGKLYVKEFFDQKRNRTVFYVPREVRDKIHAWYNGKYWLYDNTIAGSSENEESSILSIFETAAKRYDCKVFLVDNLMTADYGHMSDSDFYRAQSRVVGQLVTFANRYNVHVHLVAHPRKNGQSKSLGNDDVSGSGDITNRVANVITLSKAQDIGFGLKLEVTKNRWEGHCGSVALNYCPVSRRVYVPEVGDQKRYGWEDQEVTFEQMETVSGEAPW